MGTNNHETYDEWKLPNGKLARGINQFANAYEMTSNPECRLSAPNAKICNGAPSKRCDDIFKSTTSPYNKVFKFVDPKPFREACMMDTRCVERKDMKTALCNTIGAFTLMARAKGQWVDILPECSKYLT